MGMRNMVVVGLVAMVCAGAGLRCRAQSQDAKELIEAVSLKSNLEGSDIQPWHVRIHYQTTSLVDSQSYQGTIEEWWQSDKRLRVEFVVNGKMRRYDVTDHGTYASGDLKSLPYVVGGILSDMLWPMPPTTVLAKRSFDDASGKKLGIQMRWITISRPSTQISRKEQSCERFVWYVAPDTPNLLVAGNEHGTDESAWGSFIPFQNRTITGRYTEAMGGKIVLKANIEKLEMLPQGVLFDIPTGAAPDHGMQVSLKSGDMQNPKLIFSCDFKVPGNVIVRNQTSKVMLAGVVSAAGQLENVKAVGGSSELNQAAVASVQDWQFFPSIKDGIAVEGKIQILMTYHLRGGFLFMR